MTFSLRKLNSGVTMIEVLVSILILMIGLLGLAALQTRMQVSEIESYQRAQALILLNDMVNRMYANRYGAADYVTGTTTPLGTTSSGTNCPTTSSTRQQRDSADWCNALIGSTETGGGANLGAMVGARGCIENIGSNLYMVTVAWQGMAPVSAPPVSVACGANQYDGATGSSCTSDVCRRVVTGLVRIATL